MKVISVPLLLGLTAICAHCAVLRLPVPPQQHKSWHPDPAIPTNILSAAEMLFEQGFPDPRGCEYREIEVEVSGVWDGKARVVKTRGWVLPEKSGTNQFAICWNGLIYPVAKVSACQYSALFSAGVKAGLGFDTVPTRSSDAIQRGLTSLDGQTKLHRTAGLRADSDFVRGPVGAGL